MKLTYQYAENELYDNREILKDIEAVAKGASGKEMPPKVPGVTTLAGRLIIERLQSSLYEVAKGNIESLIDANAKVRAELKKSAKKK